MAPTCEQFAGKIIKASLPVTKEASFPAGGGEFFLGKSEELVHTLLQTYKGQVQLIYLDPPFCTGDTFSIQIGGHTKSAYTDTLSLDCYLQMMRSILSGCFDLLHPHGCLYLHADYRASAHLKILMDDIFGADHFMNEIIWAYQSGGRSTKHFSRKHDNILLYRKSRQCYFNIAAVGKPRGPDKRNHMKRSVNSDGRVLYSIRSGSKEYVYTEEQLVYPSDVWSDISHLHQRNPERNGYATQKPEALLKRILLASSRPGDIVADFFSGSGTTAAVARKTGRYFIGVDSSPYALYTLRRRLADGLPHKQVLLHFPASTLQVRLDYEKHQQAQETVIRLNGVESMNASGGILCCALGYVQNDTFHPIHHVDKPVFPALLSMPAQYAPVVRLTDLEGKQGFYSV